MALAQTRSKGRGVAVGDTWGKEEPRLGGRRGRGWGKGGVGIIIVTTRGDRRHRASICVWLSGWHLTLFSVILFSAQAPF